MTITPCAYEGCKGTPRARGYCNAHYQRLRLGMPLVPIHRRLPHGLTPSEVFNHFVIKQEGCWGWSGCSSTEGYSQFSAGGKQYYAHRISYEAHVGPIPDGLFIDHMCHNRACVNPAHLQVVTNKENHENRPGVQTNNTSGVRGVSQIKGSTRYEAYVTHWGVRHRLGNFKTLADAESAVVAKRNELYTNNLLDRRAS